MGTAAQCTDHHTGGGLAASKWKRHGPLGVCPAGPKGYLTLRGVVNRRVREFYTPWNSARGAA